MENENLVKEIDNILTAQTGNVSALIDRMAELLLKCKAALSTPISSEWQPIETAPKDGSQLLLYFVPNEVDMPSKAQIATGSYKKFGFENQATKLISNEFYMWQSDKNLGAMSYAPTHWQPLPNPPISSEKGEG